MSDLIADTILRALRNTGARGLSRSDLFYGRNLTVNKLNAALSALLSAGAARRMRVKTGGRPAEIWFVDKEEEDNNTTKL